MKTSVYVKKLVHTCELGVHVSVSFVTSGFSPGACRGDIAS